MNGKKIEKSVAVGKVESKKAVEKKQSTKKPAEKKAETKAEVTKEAVKPLVKIRVDERENEWLDSFKKAGYDVSMDKKHINFNIKSLGMHFAIQKNSIVPYIRFSSEEQRAGLEKIFSVKKYGYEVHMPAKKSDKGDSRFRAVAKRTNNEIELALEIVAKIKELKEKTATKKDNKTAKAEKKGA